MAEPVGASAEPAVAEPGAAGSGACPLLVRFGSYASGIDAATADAVNAALSNDPRTASVTVRRWGREGERDLCVTPRAAADAAQLVKVVRGAIPVRKLNGYVDVLLDGDRVFTTQD
jgi:hypothetical protein